MSSVAAAAASNIPNIFGGFAPFPNSIMIPFMGTQSAVLGYEFGLAFEAGKRTIKALPNDLFNKIVAGSPDPITVTFDGVDYPMKYKDYLDFLVKKFHSTQITKMREMMPDYMSLQNDLIEASVDIEKAKAMRTPSAWAEIVDKFAKATQEQVDNGTITGEFAAFQIGLLMKVFGFGDSNLSPQEFYDKYFGTSPPSEPTPIRPLTDQTVAIFTYNDPSGLQTYNGTFPHDYAGHQAAAAGGATLEFRQSYAIWLQETYYGITSS